MIFAYQLPGVRHLNGEQRLRDATLPEIRESRKLRNAVKVKSALEWRPATLRKAF
jgi:hypothetical protein